MPPRKANPASQPPATRRATRASLAAQTNDAASSSSLSDELPSQSSQPTPAPKRRRLRRRTSPFDAQYQESQPGPSSPRQEPVKPEPVHDPNPIIAILSSDEDDAETIPAAPPEDAQLSALERLPEELFWSIFGHLGSHRELVQLAGASRPLRHRLLDIVMTNVTFACELRELQEPSLEPFRRRLIHLRLERPLVLLYHDRGKQPSDETSPPLFPALRSLVIRDVDELRSYESADVTVAAFAVIAPTIARHAPNLATITSDISVPDSMADEAYPLVTDAWKGAEIKKKPSRKKTVRVPSMKPPFHSLQDLSFDLFITNHTLKSKVLRAFLDSLALLPALRRLTMRIKALDSISYMRCLDLNGAPHAYSSSRRCNLQRLADALHGLSSLRELNISLPTGVAPWNAEPCLVAHLGRSNVLDKIRKLSINARLKHLPKLEVDLQSSYPFSKLEEVHFHLWATECPQDLAKPPQEWALRDTTNWLAPWFRKLPLLDCIELHREEGHACKTVGASCALEGGRSFYREHVVGIPEPISLESDDDFVPFDEDEEMAVSTDSLEF